MIKQTSDYELHKAKAALRNRQMSKVSRDIGAIPPIKNLARRGATEDDFLLFCKEYFPKKFSLEFSADHLLVIGRMEKAIVRGGRFALAMPRGSGKTTLCEVATLWSMLTGRHPFVFLIGATADHAITMLKNLKMELSGNELLLEDFPAAVYPIHALEGESKRASGQLHHGQPTYVGWSATQIILPTIPGATSSGCIVRVAGITGQIRGALYTRPDSQSVRPTLAILDDLQTDESAASPSQCMNRLSTINGAIAGLAGPSRPTAIIMPCTVIHPDDLAEQILDHDIHPEWQGERMQMVYTMPSAEKMWDEYVQIRIDSFKNGGDGVEATNFYRDNQEQMDEGSVVGWKQRFNSGTELSALQHAMNLKMRSEKAFFAEYQNDPVPPDDRIEGEISVDEVLTRTNGYNRKLVSSDSSMLTAFIDVQGKCLYYLVAAWDQAFTCHVIDWGAWPDQKSSYFSLSEVKRTMRRAIPGSGLEGAIYGGLEQLCNDILGRSWDVDGGGEMKISHCLIDANWGESTEIVKQFCRRSVHAAVLTPSHGRYVGASSRPMYEYTKKAGDRVGHFWRIPARRGKSMTRHIVWDSNYWKSFAHARMSTVVGDPGCVTLWGKKPEQHRMLADHFVAEYRVRTEGRGRSVDEWKQRPGRDNHLWDCFVGCCVAGSLGGCALVGMVKSQERRKRKRVKLSELQRQKR